MTPREQHEDIIRKLSGERTVKGLTLCKLSEDIGYSHAALSSWEASIRIPTLNSLFAWANHLGYEVHLVRKST